jgi:hypothetical protein
LMTASKASRRNVGKEHRAAPRHCIRIRTYPSWHLCITIRNSADQVVVDPCRLTIIRARMAMSTKTEEKEQEKQINK